MGFTKIKYDTNHREVSQHLRRIGYEVLELMKPVDLLVCKPGKDAVFVEVKIPGSRAKWTRVQLKWIGSTRFNVIVAKSPEEAAAKLRERRYLSQGQKDRLSALLAVDGRAYFQPSEIETLIQG